MANLALRDISILLLAILVAVLVFLLLRRGNEQTTNIYQNISDTSSKERYILTLRDDPDVLDGQVAVKNKFRNLIYGAGCELTHPQAEELKKHPSFASLEKDIEVTAADIGQAVKASKQEVSWMLSRIGANGNVDADYDLFVVDTGVAVHHEDLRVVGGYSAIPGSGTYNDDNGHGTHVAGILAAKDNEKGVVGVLPGARVWSIKVLAGNGSGSLSNVIRGLDIVRWHIGNNTSRKAVNVSLGGYAGTRNYTALDRAVERLVENGVPVTVAAGNSSSNADLYTPAHTKEALTVGAYNKQNKLAPFSNYGPSLDFLAPGVDILSLFLGSPEVLSGTSMAAPIACAIAATLNDGKKTVPEIVTEMVRKAKQDQNSGDNPRIQDVTNDTTSLGVHI